MPFSLERESDGAGDTGPMSQILKRKSDGTFEAKYGKPKVGYHVRVGSPYVRTFQSRDYWTTTEVIEILDEKPGQMRFRTQNSIYLWRSH